MIDMKILLQQIIINLIERMWLIFIFHYRKDRVMATVNIQYKNTLVEELQAIEEEHPDLYKALAYDDPSLIK